MTGVAVIALAVLFVVAVLLSARSDELFRVDVRGRRVRVVRGTIAPAVLTAVRDVVRTAGVRRGRIRAVRRGAAVRVTTAGIAEPVAQRLRNVIGTHAPYGGGRPGPGGSGGPARRQRA
jgi:hypothetical protein